MWNEISKGLLASGPEPVVTWLSPQGRIELSGKTLLNAISKAANYLIDGCSFDNPIRIELGNHWQAPVWNLAALVSGVGISDQSSDVFCFSDFTAPGSKYVVSRDPFGMPERDLPLGVENASLEVRSHGDYFAPSQKLGKFAIDFAGQQLGESELVALALETANNQELSRGMAFGFLAKTPSADSVIHQALIPALVGARVVLLDGIEPDAPEVAAEKTATIIEN